MTNEEVLGYTGFHLFYFDFSLCSRKVLLCLALKGVAYTGHKVQLSDLRTPWYLGINPRGLVPVLVHDGRVVIESNDILAHVEASVPEPRLTPEEPALGSEVSQILQMQDSYHMDIRTLTFATRPVEALVGSATEKLQKMDAEDAEGLADVPGAGGQGRHQQRAFYEDILANNGITSAQIASSINTLRAAWAPLNTRYSTHSFLVGEALSLADIAIWVDVERLLKVAPSFRIAEELPHLHGAFQRLAETVTGKMPEEV